MTLSVTLKNSLLKVVFIRGSMLTPIPLCTNGSEKDLDMHLSVLSALKGEQEQEQEQELASAHLINTIYPSVICSSP